MTYSAYIYGIILNLAKPDLSSVINSFYWFILVFAAFFEGALLFFSLRRSKINTEPLPFLACFFALVSLFNQIPFYLYVSAGLSLLGILRLVKKFHEKWAMFTVITVLFTTMAGIYYHAGQPYTRPFSKMIRGERIKTIPSDALKKSGVWMSVEDLEIYSKLIDLIQKESKVGETIFVMPNNAEIYFLSERKNPFRFWSTALTAEINQEDILNQAPRLIIHHRLDAYNTPRATAILEAVKDRYSLIDSIGPFDIYRLHS